MIQEVQSVLSEAANRYRLRGHVNGATLCDRNREILGHFQSSGYFDKGPFPFGQQALDLMMSANHVALASEIALQWWPLFGDDFCARLAANPAASEALEGIKDFAHILKTLSPFAWLNEKRPGIGSVMATLTLLRLNYQLEPPHSLLNFRTDWLGACQQSVIWLRDHWRKDPSIPKEMLNRLLDCFVEIGHRSCQTPAAVTTGPGDERAALLGAGVVVADVMVDARLRSRNELSHEQFAQQLTKLKPHVVANPVSVESVLMMATSLRDSDPALSTALLEAAAVLAEFSGNSNLLEMVNNLALSPGGPSANARRAERYEQQGRPDLAVMAWHNVGASFVNAGQHEQGINALARAWDLLVLQR